MTTPAAPILPSYRRGRVPLGYFEGDRVVVVYPDGSRVAVLVIPRLEFIWNGYWDYRSGEHVLILSPNGGGKTTLAYQLMEASATPARPAYVGVYKPYDDTTLAWAKALGWPIIRDYPPPLYRRLVDRPAGYFIWPRHTFDMDVRVDDYRLADVFARLNHAEYKKDPKKHGARILYKDEIAAEEELETREKIRVRDLNRRLLTRGRSGGAGDWGGTQRPVEIDTAWYSECKHLFYGNTPEKRALDRYDEIGGMVDPGIIKAVARVLPDFHFGYIRRRGKVQCVIGP